MIYNLFNTVESKRAICGTSI